MKKFIKYILTACFALVLGACSKDEIPMTSTVDLAGEWMVTAYIDNGGELEEIYGPVMMITYNTNANDGKGIWLNDLGGFWDFSVVVPCNVPGLSFGSTEWLENQSYESGVKVFDGKVTFGGTVSPVGNMPADAIEFKLQFDDDDDPSTVYVMKGYRRTGLSGGEE